MAITTTPPPRTPEAPPSQLFDPKAYDPVMYLDSYYDHIGSENLALLKFGAEAWAEFPDDSVSSLEFGCGPTIYQAIPSVRASKKGEMRYTDYLQSNLDEIQRYIDDGQNHFDWADYVEQGLEFELSRQPTLHEVEQRVRMIQDKLRGSLAIGDVMQADPVPGDTKLYDVVQSMFVAESITSNQGVWRQILINQLSKLRVGGSYISAGLLGAESWTAKGDQVALNLDEATVREVLEELGMEIETFNVIPAEYLVDGEDTPHQGYDGMFFVKARKRG